MLRNLSLTYCAVYDKMVFHERYVAFSVMHGIPRLWVADHTCWFLIIFVLSPTLCGSGTQAKSQ